MVSIAANGLLSGIEFGKPLEHKSLRVVPLVAPSRKEPSYRLFGPDLAQEVEVNEVDADGSVPNLRVNNRLPERILLIDGQELLGAKQNRILNADVLVPASREIVIPVTCVESGRWAYSRPDFIAGKMAYRSARAAKCSQVHASLRNVQRYMSDQGQVWAGVENLMRSTDSESPSSAMADVYRQREKDLAEVREAFTLPGNSVGIAVYNGERLLGLDVFDRAATLEHHWQSLLDSYAIDWLAFGHGDAGNGELTELATPIGKLIELLRLAEWDCFDAPGEGADLRWESDRLTASALIWCEGDMQAIVHLQAFPRVK